MSALRGLRAVVVVAVLTATTGVTLAQPASAAPPVAVDDHRSMYAGQERIIDVLRNDSDPDGADELGLCRVAEPGDGDAHYAAFIEDDMLFVYVDDDVRGDITITYYACDYETLVPATLTISVTPVRRVHVVKLDRPGRLRVTNDNDRAVRFLYGSFKEARPDGRAWVEAHDSLVVRVDRHRIDWIAILARSVLAGIGHVRGIELPGDSLSHRASVALSRSEAKVWAAQR